MTYAARNVKLVSMQMLFCTGDLVAVFRPLGRSRRALHNAGEQRAKNVLDGIYKQHFGRVGC